MKKLDRDIEYITQDEMKVLWRTLERLQADVRRGHWVWKKEEYDALIKVMDAVADTYS